MSSGTKLFLFPQFKMALKRRIFNSTNIQTELQDTLVESQAMYFMQCFEG
jgi:hypothetical protein